MPNGVWDHVHIVHFSLLQVISEMAKDASGSVIVIVELSELLKTGLPELWDVGEA